jgi:hypothetical protein
MLYLLGLHHFVPETELGYQCKSSILDYLCSYRGYRVGVSVTRCFGFPYRGTISNEAVEKLLTKKIRGLVSAQANIYTHFSFATAFLHVFVATDEVALTVSLVFERLIGTLNPSAFFKIRLLVSVTDVNSVFTNRL